MKYSNIFILALLTAVLSGCGSVSPIPSDTFYRFADLSAPSPQTKAWTNGVIAIERVRASGIYKDRAIAVLNDDGVSLKQSKYHYWNDSPEVLIQQRILEHAMKAAIAPKVSLKVDNQTEYWFGGDPTTNDAAAILPTVSVGNGWMEYIFRRRNDSELLRLGYTVEASTNLVSGAWSTNGVIEAGTASVNDDVHSVTNRVSADEHATQFIRLRM